MSQTTQPPTNTNHLRSWSVVDSEELRLLREFESEIFTFVGLSARAIGLLEQLADLRLRLRR